MGHRLQSGKRQLWPLTLRGPDGLCRDHAGSPSHGRYLTRLLHHLVDLGRTLIDQIEVVPFLRACRELAVHALDVELHDQLAGIADALAGGDADILVGRTVGGKPVGLGKEVVVLDDARLTGGTIESMVRHCQQCGIKVKAVASVLNETEPTDTVTINGQDYPFVWLTKLPLMVKTKDGYRPIQGTYQGLRYFYVETQRGSAPAGSE